MGTFLPPHCANMTGITGETTSVSDSSTHSESAPKEGGFKAKLHHIGEKVSQRMSLSESLRS